MIKLLRARRVVLSGRDGSRVQFHGELFPAFQEVHITRCYPSARYLESVRELRAGFTNAMTTDNDVVVGTEKAGSIYGGSSCKCICNCERAREETQCCLHDTFPSMNVTSGRLNSSGKSSPRSRCSVPRRIHAL